MDTATQAPVPEVEVKMMSLEAVVLRANGAVENLGVVSFYHQDPLEMEKAAKLGIGKITLCE